MRFIPCALVALITTVVSAADLRFTAGAVTNTTASLGLAGPASTYVQIERLNKTNQTWQVVTNLTLSGSGSGNVNAELFSGDYGFFRAKTTNSPVQYSTNAFGSVITVMTEGWSLIGNMFGSKNLSFLPVDPQLGNSVFKWDNIGNSYDLSTYEEDDWGGISWNNNYVIEELEAVFYYNGTTNPVKWLTQGVFRPTPSTRQYRRIGQCTQAIAMH